MMGITPVFSSPQVRQTTPWAPQGVAQGFLPPPPAADRLTLNNPTLPPTLPISTPSQNLTRFFFDMGERYYQANRFQDAIGAYNVVLQQNNQDYITFNKRGVVKAAAKDYAGAMADYTQALAIKPDFYNALINRANLKAYVKDYQGALTDAAIAIRLQPMNPVAYENRSDIYNDLGLRPQALNDKRMVIWLNSIKPQQSLKLPYCPPRVALVLGNDDYMGTDNDLGGGPMNDAVAMRQVLQSQGFQVISGLNLTGAQMKGKVAEFIRALQQRPGALSMIYYSGHGGSISGNNYLIPTDYTGNVNTGFTANAVSVDYLLQELKKTNSLFNIMVLDACRNPLTTSALKSAGNIKHWSLEPGPGLSNVWIEYASSPHMPALQYDNRGQYTQALLQYMTRRDLGIDDVFRLAQYELEKDQRDDQHASSQTDISRTGPLADALSFANHC